jgi:uncharacterized C2H2 Zn-finger protein/endogenous inhibitor of DNA gyrase (YacG/DUF329 family)
VQDRRPPQAVPFPLIINYLSEANGGELRYRSKYVVSTKGSKMRNCPYCAKIFKSYKSWHRHKTLTHPSEIANKRQLYCDAPTNCKECNQLLSFEQKNNQFCSHSCAAISANRNRSPETLQKRSDTWHQNHPGQAKVLRITYRDRIQKCVGCDIEFIAPFKRVYCNSTCNQTKIGKVRYRTQCRFNLNPVDNFAMYDFDLIKQVGWYRPANHPKGYNPDGVTWDHLYRIEEGFRHKIDSNIMQRWFLGELTKLVEIRN